MEVKNIKEKYHAIAGFLKASFVKKAQESEKKEINWNQVKLLSLSIVILFVGVVLFLPDEQSIEFSAKIESETKKTSEETTGENGASSSRASNLWASPRQSFSGSSARAEINYNTSMVLGGHDGNAKTQIRMGQRLPLRMLEKVTVSDQAVPVFTELILNVETESGLSLPAGTKFYGEASYSKGTERAQIHFTSISLPSGEIKAISGMAVGKSDGQPGVAGRVSSDGAKNTAGQVLTSFVGGLAAGSIETDLLGNSKGGIQNGILSAISATAKDRAQSYGEKLKTEREWIELSAGAECDAVLTEALNLQSGDKHE